MFYVVLAIGVAVGSVVLLALGAVIGPAAGLGFAAGLLIAGLDRGR